VPSLTMRGRYLMREYWSDSDLFLRLDAEQREIYIGLWMLADDTGWLPRDIPAISAALMHYEDRAPREERTKRALERLRELGKVESHRCCLHLPAVERYPRAGKKSTEHMAEHKGHKSGQKGLNQANRIQTDLNPSPVPSLPDPSLPVVAGERAPERRSHRGGPMSTAAEVAGGFVATIARKSA
jgi:hypothetical protein